MTPDLSTLQKLQKEGIYRTAPVSMEILSDVKTPIEVLRILKNVSGHCYLLESVADNEKWGRYTFLGYDPTMEITCTDGLVKISKNGPDGLEEVEHRQVAHPADTLREILRACKSPVLEKMPPFTGGLVGYFSYDYIKYSEPKLKLEDHEQQDFRDICAKNDFTITDFRDQWVDFPEFLSYLPTLRSQNYDSVLASTAVQEMRDIRSHYYFQIDAVRREGEPIPLERLRGTIRRILFNQRQSEIIRNYEEELFNRATENGEVKILDNTKENTNDKQ